MHPFGNALGNSIVAGLSSTATPQQAEKKAKAAAHKAVLSGASPQEALMLEKQTYAQELGGTVNPVSAADNDETIDTGRRTSSVDGNAGFWLSDGNDRAFIDYNSSFDAISGFLGNSAARDLGMKFAAQTIIGHHKAQQAFDDGMNKGFVSSVRPGVRAQQQRQQQTARQLDAMNLQKWQSDQARAKMTTMEKVQLGLDVAGMTDIPVVSQIAELGSAGISLYNGDYVGAGLGVASMIPIAGKWAESAKMQRLTERVKGYSDLGSGNSDMVWNSISSARPNHPGSVIPTSFELSLSGGQKIWVDANATKHIAEYTAVKAENFAPDMVRLVSQQQLRSLSSAANTAVADGIRYRQIMRVDGWELIFAPPKTAEQLPALYHALYKAK